MTRKAKISFLILVWSIVAIQIFINYQQSSKKEEETVTAFSVVENNVIEEMVAGYGYLGKMELSEDMKEQMLKNLADKFGLGNSYEINSFAGKDYERKELSYKAGTTEIVLQLVSIDADYENINEVQKGNDAEQYILMNVGTKESVEQGKAYYDMVRRIYEEIGVRGTVNLEIMMEEKGNLLTSAKKETQALLDVLQADKVDEINENEIHTVYAYRKEEESYLMHEGEKTNVQIVMSYDEKNDKTYVKVGVPMVNSSY